MAEVYLCPVFAASYEFNPLIFKALLVATSFYTGINACIYFTYRIPRPTIFTTFSHFNPEIVQWTCPPLNMEYSIVHIRVVNMKM